MTIQINNNDNSSVNNDNDDTNNSHNKTQLLRTRKK